MGIKPGKKFLYNQQEVHATGRVARVNNAIDGKSVIHSIEVINPDEDDVGKRWVKASDLLIIEEHGNDQFLTEEK